jgi:hypothetical protein
MIINYYSVNENRNLILITENEIRMIDVINKNIKISLLQDIYCLDSQIDVSLKLIFILTNNYIIIFDFNKFVI